MHEANLSKHDTTMIEKPLSIVGCAMAILLCASLTADAGWHGHLPGFFEDTFDRPDSADLGEGWAEEVGGWSIIDERAVPDDDGVQDKILTYTDVEPVEYPFVVSADMTGLAARRWGGLAVHVQPTGPGNFYSLIARVEDPAAPGESAIQFRRYSWGTLTVLATHVLTEELTLNDYFRYTIISREPGVFELLVDKLDQETGEVLENIITFTAADDEHTGGRAGLHANAADASLAFDRFVINSQELTQPIGERTFHEAVAVRYSPEPGRVTRLQASPDLVEWHAVTLPEVSKGDPVARIFSTRFIDRQFFRVLSDL